MKDIKYRIINGWNLMRIVRFGLALLICYEAILNHDFLFGGIAVMLLIQSVLNIGCCSAGACYVSGKKNTEDKEVIFEEVKSGK